MLVLHIISILTALQPSERQRDLCATLSRARMTLTIGNYIQSIVYYYISVGYMSLGIAGAYRAAHKAKRYERKKKKLPRREKRRGACWGDATPRRHYVQLRLTQLDSPPCSHKVAKMSQYSSARAFFFFISKEMESNFGSRNFHHERAYEVC